MQLGRQHQQRASTDEGPPNNILAGNDRQHVAQKTLPLSDVQQEQVASTTLPAVLRGRYTVRRVLGMGSFGIVLLAKDTLIGRLVAIKQLHRQTDLNPMIMQRFLQEARIAGQLAHPNIVNIYTVEEVAGDCCVVMEYLGGGNLAELIRSTGAPLPPQTCVNAILGVLEGLKVAHAMGVVHRDLKPENILFDNMGTPKISDFGLAHLPGDAGGVAEPTGQALGTPCYIAPEMISGKATADPRSDLYAVGVMLFEMLAGKRVYEMCASRKITSIEQARGVAEMLSTAEFVQRVPTTLASVVRKMVDPEATHRYAGVIDAIAALRPHALPVEYSVAGKTGVVHAGARYALSNVDILRDILELLLTDGILAPDERMESERRAERLGIDEATARQIEEELRAQRGLPSRAAVEEYTASVQAILSTGDISARVRRELNAKAKKLGIDSEEQRTIETYARMRKHT